MNSFLKSKKYKIRTKLFLAYISIFIIVILGYSSSVYLLQQNQIKENISKELRVTTLLAQELIKSSVTTSVKNHLSSIANSNLKIVEEFYAKQQGGNYSVEEAKSLAKDVILTQTIGKTGYLYCLNSQGVLEVHPKKPLVNKNISEFDFVKKQIKTKNGYIVYKWKNPDEKEERYKSLYMVYFQPWDWIISASAYVEEFDKMVDLSDFKKTLNSLRFQETGYSYILDYKGNVIIHPEYEGKNVLSLKDGDGKNFIQKICQEKSGHFIYSWKGVTDSKLKDKFVIFEDIPELGWIIASAGYMEEYYKPLEVIKWIFIFAVVLIILISIPINYKITNSLILPLNHAIDKLKNANKDDYSIRLEAESHDEVGDLAECFNGYMEKLEKYQLELKEANAKLEQRVDTLQGMLPICANCKKIRDDSGYWNKLEAYLEEHSEVNFSNCICPSCMIDLYPEYCDDGSPPEEEPKNDNGTDD